MKRVYLPIEGIVNYAKHVLKCAPEIDCCTGCFFANYETFGCFKPKEFSGCTPMSREDNCHSIFAEVNEIR